MYIIKRILCDKCFEAHGSNLNTSHISHSTAVYKMNDPGLAKLQNLIEKFEKRVRTIQVRRKVW